MVKIETEESYRPHRTPFIDHLNRQCPTLRGGSFMFQSLTDSHGRLVVSVNEMSFPLLFSSYEEFKSPLF